MKSIIIADDMTGSNVSNSLLAKHGYKVGTVSNSENIENYEDYDALGIHTDSRGISPEDAYDTVYKEMEHLKNLDVKFFNKRIDSTLRGNNGYELNAMLDVLGDDTLGIIVPAFPDSGKIVIGNYMLVDGIPLELTDVKNDPTSPVTTSRVINVFKEQTDREIGVISMETIMLGISAIKDTILALKENGAQLIIIDACTNEDIETIARATLEANVDFVSVDPGPFTYYLVKHSSTVGSEKNKQKMLFVVGSVSTIAISQIARLRAELDPYVVRIDAEKLLYSGKREAEIERVTSKVLSRLDDYSMFLVATMIEKEDKLNLTEAADKAGITPREASALISKNVAIIGEKIASKMGSQLGGVYTSGGDITQAFLELTNTTGIQIKDEIIPLAVYGSIMGGDLDHKAIVTKGGLIGDEFTLVECAEYLETKISSQFY
ncbi:four-carbon acid sugar kinase family protein [Hutsoniella sourekii]